MPFARLSFVAAVAAAALSGACSFKLDRLDGVSPGDIAGTSIEDDTGDAAAFARVEPMGASKVFRALQSGAFVVNGLPAGAFVLKMSEDTDGDGFLERGAYRAVSLRNITNPDGNKELSSVLLGTVRLQGTADVTGRVLRDDTGAPLAGAQVIAYRRADDLAGDVTALVDAADQRVGDQSLPAESAVVTGADGTFTLPGVMPGDARVLALLRDGTDLFVFDSGKVPLAAGDRKDLGDVRALLQADDPKDVQVNVVVGVGGGGGANDSVHVRIQRSADPLGPAAFDGDATANSDTTIQLPIDTYDVLVVEGNSVRGGLRGVPSTTDEGQVARWVILLDAADGCDADSRDRDGDGLKSIPLARMAECAAQCAGQDGAARSSASCTLAPGGTGDGADGGTFDCNDDGDDENDPAEAACFGACAGSDADRDGVCSGPDLDPCCDAAGTCLPRCSGTPAPFDGGVLVDGGNSDGGALVDGGDVDGGALVDGGDVDGGVGAPDAGFPDAGDPPFFDQVDDPGDQDGVRSLSVGVVPAFPAPGLAVLTGTFNDGDDGPLPPAALGACSFKRDGAATAISPNAGYVAWIDARTGVCVDSLVVEGLAGTNEGAPDIAGAVQNAAGETYLFGDGVGVVRLLRGAATLADIDGSALDKRFAFVARVGADRSTLLVKLTTVHALRVSGNASASSLSLAGADLVVSGTRDGSFDIGAASLPAPGTGCCTDVWVARLAADTLAPAWAVPVGDVVDSISIDAVDAREDPASGDVVLLSRVGFGSVTFGNVSVAGDFNSGPGTALERFSSADGSPKWLTSIGNNPDFIGIGSSLALSPSGAKLFVGGSFKGPAAFFFGPTNPDFFVELDADDQTRAAFLLGYDPATGNPLDGAHLVLQPGPGEFGSDRSAEVDALDVPDDTTVIAGGDTDAALALPGAAGVVVAGPHERKARSPWVARFDGLAGVWAAAGRALGGAGNALGANDSVHAVRLLDDNAVLVAGNLGGRTVLGDVAALPRLSVESASDAFVWRVIDGGGTLTHGFEDNACSARADCGAGETCDPRSLTCVAACAADGDCAGATCDTFTGLCGAACTGAGDCGSDPTAPACTRGVCLPSCLTTLPGLLCSAVDECCDFSAGACTAAPTFFDSDVTWVFDGQSGFWQQRFVSPFPRPRTGAAMAQLGATSAVLFGGRAQGGALLSDTQVWDGGQLTWTDTATNTTPPAREGHAMAEAPSALAGAAVLLFGGDAGGAVIAGEDGWVFTRGDWSAVAPGADGTPPARTEAGLAFDGNHTVFLFGGRAADGTVLGDLWPFDTDTRTWGAEIAPGGGPVPPRAGHMMALDPTTQGIFVIGGVDGAGAVLDDVWLLDLGATPPAFTQGNPLPAPRAFAGISQDPVGDVVLVDGVDASGAPAHETFLLQPESGSFAFADAFPPDRRERPAMAFDGTAAVLFGGDETSSDGICPAVDQNLQ